MRSRILVLGLVALMLATPAVSAAGARQAWVDDVEAGQTRTHTFTNYPPSAVAHCLSVYLPTTYTITVATTDPDAVLSVTAKGVTKTISGGAGTFEVVASYCASFQVKVTGVSGSTTYALAVVSHGLVPGGPGLGLGALS